MKKFDWNDGLLPRSRRQILIVGRGETVSEFKGNNIPDVVAVLSSEYEQNGKWSNTTYHLAQPDDGWAMPLAADFESGRFFPRAQSLAEIYAEFRSAGCTAPEATILACLDQAFPKTVARLREVEAVTAGW